METPSTPTPRPKDDAAEAVVEKRMDPSSMAISLWRNPNPLPSSWFEIRLFYVRIAPCAPDLVPSHLSLSHPRREMGVSLEINGARVPASEPTAVLLRRDRIDRDAAEVTYVTTDSVRFTGPVEFEVSDGEELVLCGSLERLVPPWSNGTMVNHQGVGADKDSRTGWSMDCYSAAVVGASKFIRPKLGIAAPSMEVYVAGCCSGFPLILTQTVQLSPRKKVTRQGMLDAIPEVEETAEGETQSGLRRRALSLQVGEAEIDDYEGEIDDYEAEMKIEHNLYAEGQYYDDDGQLSWFNAGVRVGVGIGLGMCLGVGIGVGLLMRSYQATTRTFRRRFL